jgi:2-polyprenyl-3-methyl-5-hydroxy-6-metoxy-1,4-benzoquinol methylase
LVGAKKIMNSRRNIIKRRYSADADAEPKIQVVDLFCGCGGFTKGLEDAGLEVLAGIDN